MKLADMTGLKKSCAHVGVSVVNQRISGPHAGETSRLVMNRTSRNDFKKLIEKMNETKVYIRKGPSSWILYDPFRNSYISQYSWIDTSNPKHELKNDICERHALIFSIKELMELEKKREEECNRQ